MSKSFLDFLVEKKIIDSSKADIIRKEELDRNIDAQTIILRKKLLKEEDLFKAKGEFFNFPYISSKEMPDVSKNALMEISEDAANNYKIIPLRKTKDILEIGMVNPENIDAREALKFIASQKKIKIKIFIISDSDFNDLSRQYRTFKGEVKAAMRELEQELDESGKSDKKKVNKYYEESGSEKIVAEAPISKVVAVIIKHATEGRASDIHIEPMEQNLRVRFRVDGILRTNLILPTAIHSAIVSRIKILAELKIDETRIPQDGRFHTTIGSSKIDFRVSTFPTVNGEKVVMRILDSAIGFLGLNEIGLEGRSLGLIEESIKRPFGMILITGPTGSGKSTTLYSILNILNKDDINIVSLEDPIEYYMDGVSQSQVRPEIEYTFATGLRHILRQDPNVIMVGEIRDSETAELAVHAALTGHIVLSTLHTNNAIGVIPRLIDMGIEPFLLPPSLNLAVAQRLVRRLCPECKKAVDPSPSIVEMIKKEIETMPENSRAEIKEPFKIYESSGCKVCITGRKGRIAIFETVSMTDQLEEVVIKSSNENEIKNEAKRQGMVTMKQDGIIKALKGIVSIEEVLKATEE